jgi:hypothetical protein
MTVEKFGILVAVQELWNLNSFLLVLLVM